MGGGSYACVKTPPFCDSPLIPKESMKARIADTINAGNYGDVEVHAEPISFTIEIPPPKLEISCRFDWEGKDAESPVQSATKQWELF